MTNVSPAAEESDLRDFFSTAGDIETLEVKDGSNNTKRASIGFKEKEAVSAALLLNGCLLLNHALTIEETTYPAPKLVELEELERAREDVNLTKGETIASGILAKTITLGKQAGQAIKDFDERNKISETVTKSTNDAFKNVDEKLKISENAAATNVKIKEQAQKVDEKYKISTTCGAAAEVVKSTTTSAVSKMNENPTVQKASTTMSNAFNFLRRKGNAIVNKAVKQSEEEMPAEATPAMEGKAEKNTEAATA